MADTYLEVRVTLSSFIEIIEPILADALDSASTQENQNTIVLTVSSSIDLEEKIERIITSFSQELEEKIDFSIEIREKSQKDWVEEYKKSVKPIKIGRFYIRPEWIAKSEDLKDVIINPSLVFGTGDHFTTGSCVEALDEITKEGEALLDVGCGSGILALVGRKLGAKVSLCDTDELAIINSKENFQLNGETYENMWVGSANSTKETYDIVVANIVSDVIVFIKRDLKSKVKSGGKLILSGILRKYEEKVLENFSEFEILDKKQNQEWVTLILRK
ncbi:MAG: 50S ribosomal protein L11 methyltransferase [Campylobacterales bacterium]|nr:50S ribosomal protein L11 methyltransferase [Campylobacterales bacterium]